MTSIMASAQVTPAQEGDETHDPIIEEALRRVQSGKFHGGLQ